VGLFEEKQKSITDNYVRVLDVLEKLYEKSDQGWFEVLHFLKKSSIESIATYSYSDGVVPEVSICDEVPIEKVYENGYRLGQLKDALCAFIANNCDSLDGECLENKVIAESELAQKFKQYAWLKSDIQSLPEFNAINLMELLESKKPLNSHKKITSMANAIYQENKKYEELIFCIEHFSASFNRPIATISKFLKQTKFYKDCDVYIQIGNQDFIKLNKINSEKSISFVLDFLDDQKFNGIEIGFDADYYHLTHILIDRETLYYFEPLQEMLVDIRIGHEIYENIKYGDINHRKLELATNYHFQETEKFWKEHWEELKNRTVVPEPSLEPHQSNIEVHPALDKENKNHAPELILAIEAWEAKYLNDEYPHHDHTPAITNILKQQGITQVNLVKRICAITNPKK